MRRRVVSAAALAAILFLPATAGAIDPFTLQPVESERGLLISGDGESAWAVTGDGAARRLPLRRGELPTAVAETDDGWLAAGLRRLPDRRDLFLLEAEADSIRRVKPPVRSGAPLRLRPVPLVDRGSLVGLAWLEGFEPGKLDVRVAEREGRGWGATTTVARAGRRGTHTGLSGIVLADGTWLLVWASFDGGDDEIVAAERRGGVWSRPERIHPGNRVPDITPALARDGDGAVAAWGRLEGSGYRVFVSAFDGSTWGTDRAVGVAGSVYPTFARVSGRSFLLARSAAPRGWELLELGSGARVLQSALATVGSPLRPTIEVDAGAGAVALRWPQDEGARTVRWRQR